MSASSILLRSSLKHGKACRLFSRHENSSIRSLSSFYVDKLGLGGHKWSRMDPERYAQVIQTALDQNIRLLETGQEGGDVALSTALQSLSNIPNDIVILTRIGYRTLRHLDDFQEKHSHFTRRWDGDVTVEKQTTDNDKEVEIVHNISPPFLQDALDKSVLLQQHSTTTQVVPMIHNPEVQINHDDDNPQDALYDKLLAGFQAMEHAVAEDKITRFGVSSNGLALPEQHPLYLNYEIVLQAAQDAATKVYGNDTTHSNLFMLQLPANLLEPRGVHVARDIVDAKKWPLEVVCMRPLTYYPEQQQQPTSFIDYSIPTADGIVVTNHMQGPPLIYHQALNKALSHFDGTTLLEEQQQRKLTTEERETLEGCKLLQSILHDLDVGLEQVSSFAAYEHDLYQKVIPTCYGRFEELDEESSLVLQV